MPAMVKFPIWVRPIPPPTLSFLERHRRRVCAVPNADWISATREGLTICDATSAAFAQKLRLGQARCRDLLLAKAPYGGEAAHGMLVLGRTPSRLAESYTPAWPLPKSSAVTKGGKLNEGIFEGETINTHRCCPSRGLSRRAPLGGVGRRPQGPDVTCHQHQGAHRLEGANAVGGFFFWPRIGGPLQYLGVLAGGRSDRHRVDAGCAGGFRQEARRGRRGGRRLRLGAYRDAPAGLRIWCGATVEAQRRRD